MGVSSSREPHCGGRRLGRGTGHRGYGLQPQQVLARPAGPGDDQRIRSLPPGCAQTLWNDHERYLQSYLAAYPGYYHTGDGGYLDAEGFVHVMGRTDDVINVAGHRLSTGEMEDLVARHPAVAECAVIGVPDAIKGQVPLGLIVLKDGARLAEQQLQRELTATIREQIGALACFQRIALVKRLPKTRSGKILRAVLRKLANGEEVAIPSTIDDPAILGEIGATLAPYTHAS